MLTGFFYITLKYSYLAIVYKYSTSSPLNLLSLTLSLRKTARLPTNFTYVLLLLNVYSNLIENTGRLMKHLKVYCLALLMILLISCGGDEPINVKIIFTPEGTELLITQNNLTIVKEPDYGTTVIISGNNNFITLTKKPKRVEINGNDNSIKIINGTPYTDNGRGNSIILIK